MLVKEVMQRAVFTVRDDERLSHVLREMLQRGIRHAPVMHGDRLSGVLSERNVLAHRARFERDGPVREAMTESPYVIDAESSLASAAALMASHKLGCLPVMDGAKLVGIITTTDLLASMAVEEVPAPAPGPLFARDVMRTPVEAVHADDTLLDAARRMLRRGVRHLPVLNGARELVGLLSDRDVRTALGDPRAALADGKLPALLTTTRVGAVMSPEPYTILPDLPLDAVGRLLADERLGALPVVGEQGQLLGIISYVDVLHVLLGSQR